MNQQRPLMEPEGLIALGPPPPLEHPLPQSVTQSLTHSFTQPLQQPLQHPLAQHTLPQTVQMHPLQTQPLQQLQHPLATPMQPLQPLQPLQQPAQQTSPQDVKVSAHGRIIKRKKFDDEEEESPKKGNKKEDKADDDKKEKKRKTSKKENKFDVLASPTSIPMGLITMHPLLSPSSAPPPPLTLHPTTPIKADLILPTTPTTPTTPTEPPKRRGPGRPPGTGKKQKAAAAAAASGIPTPVDSPTSPAVTPKVYKRGPYKKRGSKPESGPVSPIVEPPSNLNFDKWTPSDDLMLKEAAQTNSSFEKIAKKIKFSFKFSPRDIEERWKALLYDPEVAAQAAKAMAAAPTLNKRVLWSAEEEEIIKREVSAPTFTGFQSVLERFRDSFHSSRTAKSLEAHYYRMKRTGAFDKKPSEQPADANADQKVDGGTPLTGVMPTASMESVGALSQSNSIEALRNKYFEEMDFNQVEDDSLNVPLDSMDPEVVKQKKEEYVKQELQHQKEILQLEREVQKERDMDPTALGLLRGIKLRYYIKSRKITLGRNTKEATVDVNLSEEGPATKASRKQAIITLKPNCCFYIKNLGKKPIFVNGKSVESGQTKKLTDGCIIEIGYLRFILDINQQLIDKIKSLTMPTSNGTIKEETTVEQAESPKQQ